MLDPSYIYIYILLLTASLPLSLSLFLFIDMVQNDYFYSNVYLDGEKEKEAVWFRSFDTIGRHHFRQQYITHEKTTI
jgi:hypothetical protein